MDYVNGKNDFEEVEIQSAKSCAMYGVIAHEKTAVSAARQACLAHFKGVSSDYSKYRH